MRKLSPQLMASPSTIDVQELYSPKPRNSKDMQVFGGSTFNLRSPASTFHSRNNSLPVKLYFKQKSKQISQTNKFANVRNYSVRKFHLPERTFNERINNKLPSKPSVANLQLLQTHDTFNMTSTSNLKQQNMDLAPLDFNFSSSRNAFPNPSSTVTHHIRSHLPGINNKRIIAQDSMKI